MKVGTEDKRKLMIAGVVGFFALLALYPLYQELFGGPASAPAAPAVIVTSTGSTSAGSSTGTGVTNRAVLTPPGFAVGQAAQRVGTTSALLDPTLHMEAMRVTESLVYSGSGRNIFAAGPSALEIAAKAPARPKVVIPTPVQSVRVETGPPPPPAINLKFFGTATTADGVRRALLLNGEDVFLASAGDIVQRRYRVVSIAANSILVEDLPNSNQQTLPLVAN